MPAVSIATSVGGFGVAAAKSAPFEENAVQELVRKAGIPFRGPRLFAGDIEVFQKMVGLKADGRVDKGGLTLRYLNAVANPPKLHVKDSIVFGGGLGQSTVSSQGILYGGYQITYTTEDGGKGDTKIPPPYRVLLGVDAANTIDVTGRPMKDVMNAAKLAELLGLIERRNAWGTSISLMLFVTLEREVISSSNSMNLLCPVKPHSGRMLSDDENKDLFYLGVLAPEGSKDKDQFYGRFFRQVPGYDKYLFCWGGYLELGADKRGFDCITYAGTTCGAKPADLGGNGESLAAALNATDVVHDKVTLNKARMSVLKSFFEKNTTGYYLLYSSGHVTLVVDGYVYEFKPNRPGNKGFTKTKTSDWVDTHKDGWTLKKLPNKPPLAAF
jgi:hypothetical protein